VVLQVLQELQVQVAMMVLQVHQEVQE
jgi:hypothetical protein